MLLQACKCPRLLWACCFRCHCRCRCYGHCRCSAAAAATATTAALTPAAAKQPLIWRQKYAAAAAATAAALTAADCCCKLANALGYSGLAAATAAATATAAALSYSLARSPLRLPGENTVPLKDELVPKPRHILATELSKLRNSASATPKQQGPEGRKSIKIATKNSLM